MEFLTIKETARMLRVSPITIRRYIASGRLEAERVGRGIRIRPEAVERFVTPVAPVATKSDPSHNDELPTIVEALGVSIGIGRTIDPTNIAEHKDEYVADAILTSSDEIPTMYEALKGIIGIGWSDGPTDVSRNKHKYLAEAYLSYKER